MADVWSVPMSRVRKRYCPHSVVVRYVASYFIRRFSGLSYPRIGRLLGIHYTTVIRGVKSIADRMDDPVFCVMMHEAGRRIYDEIAGSANA